jgi:hypothetical protein
MARKYTPVEIDRMREALRIKLVGYPESEVEKQLMERIASGTDPTELEKDAAEIRERWANHDHGQ